MCVCVDQHSRSDVICPPEFYLTPTAAAAAGLFLLEAATALAQTVR